MHPSEATIIIAGSGAAGLVAAITAARCGLRPVVLEKADVWGGTTAMSGGSLWIPGHPLMARNGVPDDLVAARAYLDSHISQAGPAASTARRDAFIASGPEMVSFLADNGFEWDFSPFPDYYPEQEGATYGRGVAPALYDGARLGIWRKSMRRMNRIPNLVILPHEFKAMLMATQNLSNLVTAARVALRTAWWRMRGKQPMFIGQALAGQLMEVALKLGVEVRLNSGITGLLVEDGAVVGVTAQTPQGTQELRAPAGVILCAGGFSRNAQVRKRYQDLGSDYSVANPQDQGDALLAALALGAQTALMDDAWWGISAVFPDGGRSFLLWERTLPHSIIVDPAGERFVNEAAPYNDAGRALLERKRQFPSDDCWLVMDARHRRNYTFANLLGGYNPRSLLDSGFLVKADSLDGLAAKCGIDAEGLRRTVSRFNGFARSGIDEDFHRGESLFDTIYGDEKVKPNPCLGTMEQAPFWAVRVYPSDLGSKGGLLTDEDGRVLNERNAPIPGLYAAGNTAASVMGRGYPGPGSTLGPAAVFAYRAAQHAAHGRIASD
jgi:3-oxosteroid 1-dehydrogenase